VHKQAVLKTPAMQNAMKLRGGMSNLGPLNPGNFNGAMQVAAAVTAAAAVTEKYGGIGETALTKKFKGDVWNTNLIISLVTGGASAVVYSVTGSAFEAAKVTSILWLVSVLAKLQDAEFDVKTLLDDKVETVVALAATYFAFA
jgi:hypothetical protein